MRIAALTIAYSVAGAAASLLQSQAGAVGLYWPAAGIGVGGLLVLPRRVWPAFLGSLFIVLVVFDLLTGQDLLTTLVWPVANLTGHVLVAVLIRRWKAGRFDSVRAVSAFIAAALLGSIPAAALGAVGSFPVDVEVSFLGAATGWLVGDFLGVLTAAPVVLTLAGRIPLVRERRTEAMVVLAASILVTAALFTRPDPGFAAQLSYVVLLPLLWAAIRCRVGGVAVVVLTSTVIAVVGTSLDAGPFAVPTVPVAGRSVLLHLFLSGMTATALLLAARTVESETYHDIADDRAHLLATVSHELRTPLTPIVGFSELLMSRGSNLDDATRNGLDVILRNGIHLTALVDNLLLLQRARRDQIAATWTDLDLVALVERHLDSRSDPQPVALYAEPGPVTVNADPTHLERIIANLLDNAFRHGEPPVWVELTATSTEAVVAIVDHGAGVEAWFAPQLYEAFSQQVVGDQRSSIGLGLGLAICRDLAEAIGATLHHDTGVPGPTRFTLRLARADATTRPSTEDPLDSS